MEKKCNSKKNHAKNKGEGTIATTGNTVAEAKETACKFLRP